MQNNRTQQIKKEYTDNLINVHGLYELDESVKNYFDEYINIFINENSQKIKVPIHIATPERWSQIKQFRSLRDGKKQLILPIMAIKRNDISIPAEFYIPKITNSNVMIKKQIAKESSWKSGDPIYEIKSFKIPTYIQSTYTIYLATRYNSSLNQIIQKILSFGQNGYITSKSGINIKWELGGFSNNSNEDDFSDEIRLYSSECDFTIESYITINQDEKDNIIKTFSGNQIKFNENII